MKIIRQIGIIMGLCWVALIIEKLLPISFPASVIGMILLLICLFTGILKLEHIREKSDFLLANMSFFFVPAGVSMINYLDVILDNLIPLLVISVVSTFVTFATAAFAIRLTMSLMSKKMSITGGNDHE